MATTPKPQGVILEPFNFKGVQLLDGPLKVQRDEVMDYYLRIPNMDLLKGFRARAGLPAPGNDLGGWYSADGFHVFGQILSGLARLYAATGNEACKEKATALIQEWGKCIDPDGFFYYTREPNAPLYVYDRYFSGLLDNFLYCDNKEARRLMDTMLDYGQKNLDRTNKYGYTAWDGPTEWYTLSENPYRTYLATGEQKYRDFGKIWEYTDYWSLYANKQDIFGKLPNGHTIESYHAFSHVNTLLGASAAYMVTGDQFYLSTIKNAYDFFQEKQCFATGGYGPGERIRPTDEVVKSMYVTHDTFETQCGTWAANKLCRYLISFTEDAKYGDWMERLMINGIGASIPMPADGRSFYYSDYNPTGAYKTTVNFGWSCCTGTKPMAVADFSDMIYLRGPQGLYVNLYTPSTVEMSSKGFALKQTTRFPEEPTSTFTITRGGNTAIHLRVPAWLAAPMKITINGEPIQAKPNANHWLVLKRDWKKGDVVKVELPMKFWTSYFGSNEKNPAALCYGPVVMAARYTDKNPAPLIDIKNPGEGLVPSPGEKLVFNLKKDPSILVRPFYAYKADERYVMYIDPNCASTLPVWTLKYSNSWKYGGFRFTDAAGSTVECKFSGTGIRLHAFYFDDAGQAEVRIDGKVVGVIDYYSAKNREPLTWEKTGLQPGEHSIKLTVLPSKNSASKGNFVNVSSFERMD